MQTFLPYRDFAESARCLDNKRLGKQRVENLTIMSILLGQAKSNAWKNHPAVRMWRGYTWAFYQYHNAICKEWRSRGFSDTCQQKMFAMIFSSPDDVKKSANISVLPNWIGNENFHLSHKQALMFKDKNHYSKFFPDVEQKLEYVWPA